MSNNSVMSGYYPCIKALVLVPQVNRRTFVSVAEATTLTEQLQS
ncbi:hypothetical protein [Brasilonema sp. UFV-L1]